jgi:hypothetical protein
LRKAAARTTDELWQPIGRLLASLLSAECANYATIAVMVPPNVKMV